MGEGNGFPEAFRQAIGIPARELEDEFRRYVVGAGWRS